MNIFILLISILMGYSNGVSQHTTIDSALDHVVTYITYPNTTGTQQGEEKVCQTSFYFYSNHTDKIIKVKYLMVEGEDRTTMTATLFPMYKSEQESGRQRISTRPKKIDGTCEASVEIVEAWFVE